MLERCFRIRRVHHVCIVTVRRVFWKRGRTRPRRSCSRPHARVLHAPSMWWDHQRWSGSTLATLSPLFPCDYYDAKGPFFIAEKIEKNPQEKYLIIDTFSGLCRMAFEWLSCINPPVSLPVVSSNRYGGLLADPVGIFPEKNFQEFAVWHKVQ